MTTEFPFIFQGFDVALKSKAVNNLLLEQKTANSS